MEPAFARLDFELSAPQKNRAMRGTVKFHLCRLLKPFSVFTLLVGRQEGHLDLDNSRQEPEAISATSGCALRKSGEPTLEGR